MSDLHTLEPPARDAPAGIRRGFDADGRRIVARTATGARRSVLRREAEVLAALRGNGVVELVRSDEGEDHTEVQTLDAGRSTLAAEQDRDARRRRATLAAAAVALAAIHGQGWSHGAVILEHAVVDAAGGVRWCSLGSATNSGDLDGAVESDRRALLAAALQVADGMKGGRRLRRELLALGPCPAPDAVARTVRPPHRRDRPRRPGPRRARVTRRVPAFRVPRTAGDGRPGPPPRTVAAGAALAVTVLMAVTVLVGAARSTRRPTSPAPGFASVRTAPTGPGPTVVLDGMVLGVGRAGDMVTTVDPGCHGRPVVLLLRPASGEVFTFPAPRGAGNPVAGRPVARVPGAVDWSSAGPCGPARLRRADGSTSPVDPG